MKKIYIHIKEAPEKFSIARLAPKQDDPIFGQGYGSRAAVTPKQWERIKRKLRGWAEFQTELKTLNCTDTYSAILAREMEKIL